MEDVGILYGHLVHFTVFCYILLTFGIVCGNLVCFPPFWYFVPRKIWQPCTRLKDSPSLASNARVLSFQACGVRFESA
jgi:hypothetical protein